MKIKYDKMVFPLGAWLPTSIMIPTVVPAYYKPSGVGSARVPLDYVVVEHDVKNRALHVSGLLRVIKGNHYVKYINDKSLLLPEIKFDDVGVMLKVVGFKLSKQR